MIFRSKKDQKKIFIFGKWYRIRKLSQFDFLEEGGTPISLFSMTGAGGRDASKSIFNAIKTSEEKEKELQLQKDIIKKVLKVAVIGPKNFKTKSLKWDQAKILYSIILDFSLKKFKRVFEIERSRVITLDCIARRYGKTPADYLFPGEELSPFEKVMFNDFIGFNAIIIEREQEAAEIKRATSKAGRK